MEVTGTGSPAIQVSAGAVAEEAGLAGRSAAAVAAEEDREPTVEMEATAGAAEAVVSAARAAQVVPD